MRPDIPDPTVLFGSYLRQTQGIFGEKEPGASWGVSTFAAAFNSPIHFQLFSCFCWDLRSPDPVQSDDRTSNWWGGGKRSKGRT